MPTPSVDKFKKIATEFYDNWNFPNCVGSINRKHIRVRCQKKTSECMYNYKQFFSIVLIVVADANYRFLTIDVRVYGKDRDDSVLSNSKLC